MAGISVVVVSSTALLSLYAPGYELHSALISVSVWLIISSLMLTGLKYHPHKLFGWGNRVTAGRAAVTTLLAGFTPVASQIPAESIWLWLIALTATCTLCLDGLDGYLARKTKLTSAYGARFDMETDALLGLVITLFVWQSGKVGPWILALGLMRYVFLAASIVFAQLRAPLFPSLRRKTVCVIQVGALCLMLCPWIKADAASAIGAAALFCLSWSFLVDTTWLFRHRQRFDCNTHSTIPGMHPNNETSA